ncbi:hypothetical protein KSS87_010527, partial [Heliosperma pusillum]
MLCIIIKNPIINLLASWADAMKRTQQTKTSIQALLSFIYRKKTYKNGFFCGFQGFSPCSYYQFAISISSSCRATSREVVQIEIISICLHVNIL